MNTPRIMIIEDGLGLAEEVQLFLRRAGYQAQSAGDSAAALSRIEQIAEVKRKGSR